MRQTNNRSIRYLSNIVKLESNTTGNRNQKVQRAAKAIIHSQSIYSTKRSFSRIFSKLNRFPKQNKKWIKKQNWLHYQKNETSFRAQDTLDHQMHQPLPGDHGTIAQNILLPTYGAYTAKTTKCPVNYDNKEYRHPTSLKLAISTLLVTFSPLNRHRQATPLILLCSSSWMTTFERQQLVTQQIHSLLITLAVPSPISKRCYLIMTSKQFLNCTPFSYIETHNGSTPTTLINWYPNQHCQIGTIWQNSSCQQQKSSIS